MAARQNPNTAIIRECVGRWLSMVGAKPFTLSDMAQALDQKLKAAGVFDFEKPLSNELIRRVDKGLLYAKLVSRKAGTGRPPHLYKQTEKALAK